MDHFGQSKIIHVVRIGIHFPRVSAPILSPYGGTPPNPQPPPPTPIPDSHRGKAPPGFPTRSHGLPSVPRPTDQAPNSLLKTVGFSDNPRAHIRVNDDHHKSRRLARLGNGWVGSWGGGEGDGGDGRGRPVARDDRPSPPLNLPPEPVLPRGNPYPPPPPPPLPSSAMALVGVRYHDTCRFIFKMSKKKNADSTHFLQQKTPICYVKFKTNTHFPCS